ncbi:MAG: FixH family protein [Chromatiales bacterium]|nr:FixH family protein [Chromatiales bacterium]
MTVYLLRALTVVTALLVTAVAVAEPMERRTAHGWFTVRAEPFEPPVPVNEMHAWRIEVLNDEGRPVPGAKITVGGGMAEHGHGLPTAPRSVETETPGVYRIDGLRFHMHGWWQVWLRIERAALIDHVTFDLRL